MQADIGGGTVMITYVGRRRTHGHLFGGLARATVIAGIAVLIGAAIGFGVVAQRAHPGLPHLTTFPSFGATSRAL
jgi:hypothetical protein